ncbi:MAG TPA: tRNA guanosine(34) transglycosylase Tgt [Candidatus Acidoferrales bacterium]|nr:tRNA guanosine(34) transglycosylase Tgt [Candidatus Acidoferrales bacterium]
MSAFTLQRSVAGARAGTLHTAHGDIATPVFMPVGTQASVKGVSPQELAACGIGIILANAYHLYLRPGAELIARAGGLHEFMSWPGAILTDSGGFQVFSLTRLARIDDEGYHFASHLDGSRHTFTPESVVALQEALGSDIAMVLDDVAPAGVEEPRARESALRTLQWARRAKQSIQRGDQLTFAIVQGSTFEDLRRRQAQELAALDFPGYAIGGLWVGEERSLGLAMVAATTSELPHDKPRYLMGVGTPEDLIVSMARGVDMFDCVYPTRSARHALALTSAGRLNLRNASFTQDFQPLDSTCRCAVCAAFTRAYLAHLFRAGEMLAPRLVSVHNIFFLNELVKEARGAIVDGTFASWSVQRLASLRDAATVEPK